MCDNPMRQGCVFGFQICYVAMDGLEHLTLLPPPTTHRDYRCKPHTKFMCFWGLKLMTSRNARLVLYQLTEPLPGLSHYFLPPHLFGWPAAFWLLSCEHTMLSLTYFMECPPYSISSLLLGGLVRSGLNTCFFFWLFFLSFYTENLVLNVSIPMVPCARLLHSHAAQHLICTRL